MKTNSIRYKLNPKDIDTDEPDKLILNLPKGFRFDYDPFDVNHIWAFESLKEIKDSIRAGCIVKCDCKECSE